MEIAQTIYVFKGADRKQAKDLYDKIQSLTRMKKPLVENRWGGAYNNKLYLGCLISLFGGNYKEMFCDGVIRSFKLNQNTVKMECDTVNGETDGFRHFIERQYSGSKIYYRMRRDDIGFFTNDKNGEYFKGRYYVFCEDVFCEDEADYCETIEEAAEFFSACFEKKVKPNYAEIIKEVENHNNNGGGYCFFRKVEFSND